MRSSPIAERQSVGGAGILALAIYALVLTGRERDVYLTTIPVNGVTSIPAQEIVEASELAGAHIFSADPGIAAENIMRVPGVISALKSDDIIRVF